MVSTLDFESSDPSSNLGGTLAKLYFSFYIAREETLNGIMSKRIMSRDISQTMENGPLQKVVVVEGGWKKVFFR